MRLEDIRQLTRAQPFVPFRVFTTLGQTFDIRHPDMILATPGIVHVISPHPENPADTEGWVTILSLYHLQKVEYLPNPPTKPDSNGVPQQEN
jgi:hypothetical protein